MKSLLLAGVSIAMTAVSTPSLAQEKQLTPDVFKRAFVKIIDEASDGCWTNIKEAKRYAEDQFELAGFPVDREMNEITDLNEAEIVIWLTGKRRDNGICFGSYSASVNTPLHFEEIDKYYIARVGAGASADYLNNENANTAVLNAIKEFAESWPNLPPSQ